MVDGDGNGYIDGSYADSWVVANAGAPGNDQVNVEFPGGYAGKCPTGQKWSDTSSDIDPPNWECTGAVQDWDQAVLVPDIEDGSVDETVGIVVMPYNFKETLSAGFETGIDDIESNPDNGIETNELSDVVTYRMAAARASSDIGDAADAPTLDNISVRCYPDSNPSGGFEKSDINIDPTSQVPIAVTGQIDLSGSESYTCNWNYTSSDGDRNPVNNAGTPIDLSESGEKNDVLFNFFRDDRGFSGLKKSYSSSGFEDALGNWN